MLEDIEIEKIIQDIDSGLTDYTIGKKYKHSHNTIADIRKEHETADVGESQKESKKQEVHFDNPIDKMRAIPKAIDDFIETERLKADDRVKWGKRKEEIKEILRVEVDDRIAEERKDATKISDEQWQEHIEENFEEKGVVAFLRRGIERRETAIEGLTKSIEEGDEFTASLRDRNITLIKKIGEKDNLNTNLNNKNVYLNDFIDNFLDDAGRRERSKLRSERKKIDQEREEWVEWGKERSEEQKLMDEQKLNIRLKRKKITQERAEWDKERSEGQKLLDDQVVKLQIERNELEQEKYELKQKGGAIAAEKKDLMAFAGEIGRDLLVLSKVEQEIERNKHLSFLTADPSKRVL